MNKIVKVLAIYILAFTILSTCIMLAEAKTVLDSNSTEGYLNTIATKLMSTYPNPKCQTSGGDWTVMALARDGSINKEYKAVYLDNLLKHVQKNKGVLSEKKYTEYSRVVLALTSIGENPEDFGGYNLVEPLYDVDKVSIQGINGIAYALIALDSGDYSNGKGDKGKTAREEYQRTILNAQLPAGGWCMTGDTADADMTAICIQALLPYRNNKDVEKAINNAFSALSNIQCESGAFTSGGVEVCESTAQVLVALSEAGISIEDKRFEKNGNTVLDGMLAFYKNGGFSHLIGKSKNAIATDQAMYSLVSYYRSINNRNRLWDMSDGLVYRTVGERIKEDATVKENVTVANKNNAEVTTDKESAPDKNSGNTSSNNKQNNNKNESKDKGKTSSKGDKKDGNISDNVTREEKTLVENQSEENTSEKSDGKLDDENDTRESHTQGDIIKEEVSENEALSEEERTELSDDKLENEKPDDATYSIRIVVLLLIIAVSFGTNHLLIWLRKKGKIK